jgi:hypothetical protein
VIVSIIGRFVESAVEDVRFRFIMSQESQDAGNGMETEIADLLKFCDRR